MKLPRPLSHSSISLYQECPQKYKFRYIDNIPEKPKHFFSFGRSMHSALEYFYGVKTVTPPTLQQLLDSYKQTWVAEGYQSVAQETEYFDEGKRILTGFHQKHSKIFHSPLFVEYGFEFEVEGVPVKGYVDRIDKTQDGKINIVDYKTGKKLATGRLEVDAQLTMYQYACESLLGMEVDELVFYHLPTLKEHKATRRSGKLVSDLKQVIVETAESITQEKFDPKPEESVCRWCDYKPLCPIFKNQYADVPPKSARMSGEPELASLVDEYGEALKKVEEARINASKISEKLALALKAKGYVRAFGKNFEATMTPAIRWEFMDKKKVLEILNESGLYQQILAPSAPLINKLISNDETNANVRARLTELGEKIETDEIKIKPL